MIEGGVRKKWKREILWRKVIINHIISIGYPLVILGLHCINVGKWKREV
jgi:hypothetical protein